MKRRRLQLRLFGREAREPFAREALDDDPHVRGFRMDVVMGRVVGVEPSTRRRRSRSKIRGWKPQIVALAL